MARPSLKMPPALRALQQRKLKTPGGVREMVEILALVLQHDEQAVLTAIELAVQAGAPTNTHILARRAMRHNPVAGPLSLCAAMFRLGGLSER
jgi:hypothetical protein